MTFAYQPAAMPAALAGLVGRPRKHRPMFHVALIGPARTLPVLGLLDTGADYTIFPDRVAAQVGLDLSRAVPVACQGVGGTSLLAQFLPVTLRVSDGVESREWPGFVGFAAISTPYALLGDLGFLEFFDANFRSVRREVELTVNTRYAGT